MKFILNLFKSIVIGAWLIIAIFVTVCLLSQNQFNVSVLGDKTLLKIDNDEFDPTYKNGDLVIVKKEANKKMKIGDSVFFYNGNKENEYLINMGKITKITPVTSMETTFEINGEPFSSEYVIGREDTVTKYSHVGMVLGAFESRWGYLFLVILPTLFAFVYEIFRIVEEVKEAKKES